MYQNNEMAAILVYGTGISSFLFKYFVLFHHPTGATDHVSENDFLAQTKRIIKSLRQRHGQRRTFETKEFVMQDKSVNNLKLFTSFVFCTRSQGYSQRLCYSQLNVRISSL